MLIELIQSNLMLILPAIATLILGWIIPSPKYKKIKKALKILMDAVEDDMISDSEMKAIVKAIKAIFEKETSE